MNEYGSSTATAREDGSLLLALLAILVIGGLVTVLLAATVTGQRQVHFDRNFSNAIHPADSGLEAGITFINSKEAEARVAEGTTYSGIGHVDSESGYTFEWTAAKTGKSEWEIRSTGVAPDGTDRTVEANVVPQPFFLYAAFAKTKVGLGGGNSADSYDPDDDGNLDTFGDIEIPTGRGILGSNGTIVIDNQTTAQNTDGVELHNWQDGDTLEGRVQGTCASCDDFRTFVQDDPVNGKLYGVFERPLTFDDWWITRTLTAGEDWNASSPYWRGGDDPRQCNDQLSTHSGSVANTIEFTDDAILVDGSPTGIGTNGIPSGVYCANEVSFTGASHDRIDVAGTTRDKDPVIIYTDGPVSVASQLNINCSNSPYTCENGYPISSDVQLYTTGSTVTIENQTDWAGVIYAPDALCGGASSNASADIFGSIVCDNLESVGNWSFHFDEALEDVKAQEYSVSVWREEPTGSSF